MKANLGDCRVMVLISLMEGIDINKDIDHGKFVIPYGTTRTTSKNTLTVPYEL